MYKILATLDPMNATTLEIDRANLLQKLLNQADHAYHVQQTPMFEDGVYDRLLQELKTLESAYPELQRQDSPTQRVGGMSVSAEVAHRSKMLSLDNCFDQADLAAWFERTDRSLPIYCELKIDGLAVSLVYEEGILIQAATRGDGQVGENVTTAIKTIKSIPLKLTTSNSGRVEVRGEVYMPKSAFEKLNAQNQQTETPLFANARNAASGTLRLKDSRIVAQRGLAFFAYEYRGCTSQDQALLELKEMGFAVEPNGRCCRSLNQVHAYLEEWENKRESLNYLTDGIVLKVNRQADRDRLGFTQKAPKGAIAYKFASPELTATLERVEFQVGRTGSITPVACFTPVELCGTTVTRATLHNGDRIKELNLHLGDTIIVRKAAEIIPEVLSVVRELRPSGAKIVQMPEKCPACHSSLLQTGASHRCSNSKCVAILKESLQHWGSRGALDIDGLGESVIDLLISVGVKTPDALYKLSIEQLESHDMGRKSAENLVSAIRKSKAQGAQKILYGLGIMLVGEGVARKLVGQFGSIRTLASATQADLLEVSGVGKEIAKSVIDWFAQEENQILINSLASQGLEIDSNGSAVGDSSGALSGKTFVVTGTLPNYSRAAISDFIAQHGGTVSSSVSQKIHYLVAGESAGSKLKKAQSLNIPILNEDALMALVK